MDGLALREQVRVHLAGRLLRRQPLQGRGARGRSKADSHRHAVACQQALGQGDAEPRPQRLVGGGEAVRHLCGGDETEGGAGCVWVGGGV